MRSLIATCLLATFAVAQAESEPKKPRRSLADGLVRQLVEIEGYRLPTIRSGLAVGSGKGPMVLLLMHPDGAIEVRELQRGQGDHGPAAKPRAMAPGVVEEIEEVEVEEVEAVEEEEVLEEEPIDPAKPKKVEKANAPAPAEPPPLTTLRLRQQGERLLVGETAFDGKQLDLAKLRSLFAELAPRARNRGRPT